MKRKKIDLKETSKVGLSKILNKLTLRIIIKKDNSHSPAIRLISKMTHKKSNLQEKEQKEAKRNNNQHKITSLVNSMKREKIIKENSLKKRKVT